MQRQLNTSPLVLLLLLGLALLFGGAYAAAYAGAGDKVPRDTTVAGVEVGGMTPDDAVAALEKGLADRVVELTGSESEITYMDYEEAYGEGYEDMQRRYPDTSLARRLIGYEPTRDLNAIIDSIIEYRRSVEAVPTPA